MFYTGTARGARDKYEVCRQPGFSASVEMFLAGSAIVQGVNQLEDLVRGFQSTKWLLLAGASDPPCKTSTRRARNCDRNGTFLQGVTKDLASMENSPIVKNCLHNTVRKGPSKNFLHWHCLLPRPTNIIRSAHFRQICQCILFPRHFFCNIPKSPKVYTASKCLQLQ